MGLLKGVALVYIAALIVATVDESSRLEDTESREERVGVEEFHAETTYRLGGVSSVRESGTLF
jgi:hypothetical protein